MISKKRPSDVAPKKMSLSVLPSSDPSAHYYMRDRSRPSLDSASMNQFLFPEDLPPMSCSSPFIVDMSEFYPYQIEGAPESESEIAQSFFSDLVLHSSCQPPPSTASAGLISATPSHALGGEYYSPDGFMGLSPYAGSPAAGVYDDGSTPPPFSTDYLVEGGHAAHSMPSDYPYLDPDLTRPQHQHRQQAQLQVPRQSTPRSPSLRSESPDAGDLTNYGTQNADGTWRCAYPGCSSRTVFTRACDLRKHFNRHNKYLFCRYEGCPQATEGGFSSKKDRARHEAKHNPEIMCEWEGCGRVFSRVDNMKDHVRRIHKKRSR